MGNNVKNSGVERNVGRVALISAEPWDEVWRRNQHLVVRLVRLGLAERVLFISPPAKLQHRVTFEPEPRVRVVTPHQVLPRDRGGLRQVAAEVRARFLRNIDVLWINDAVIGARCLRDDLPAVYDVTDDWRESRLPQVERTRLIAAEDVLARTVETIVCSEVLRDRWADRYDVVPSVVHNGVDFEAYAGALPLDLPGPGPHVMYVGTLHRERLDLDVVAGLAWGGEGTIHLVGPDHLDETTRHSLQHAGIRLHGPVPHAEVPAWMASADLLVCPHRVDSFTLSLDAIKSFEYVASGRTVVATPTSGFQSLAPHEGVHVVDRGRFLETVSALAREHMPALARRGAEYDWSIRAREFAAQLASAEAPRA